MKWLEGGEKRRREEKAKREEKESIRLRGEEKPSLHLFSFLQERGRKVTQEKRVEAKLSATVPFF